jgi:hypothetical protein
METDTAVLNRQALALFNFWLKKQPKNKRIGELTPCDFIEMITFLHKMEMQNENN